MGERCLGWHTACDNVRGSWGLDDSALTGPAGVFWPPCNDHPELGRDDVKPFADILTDGMTLGSAGAG